MNKEIEEEIEILKDRKRYHVKPRKWKLENPAYHSCMRCLHLKTINPEEPLTMGKNAWQYCVVADVFFARIARYYPNECEHFVETKFSRGFETSHERLAAEIVMATKTTQKRRNL